MALANGCGSKSQSSACPPLPAVRNHSYRIASSGWTPAARRAGIQQASADTASSTPAAAPNATGSCGLTWNNRLETYVPIASRRQCAPREPRHHRHHALPQHQPEHDSRPRSQRHANADLRAPPRYRMRNHTIRSERRQRQRGDRKQQHQPHLESPPRHGFVQDLLERAFFGHRYVGVRAPDRRPQHRGQRFRIHRRPHQNRRRVLRPLPHRNIQHVDRILIEARAARIPHHPYHLVNFSHVHQLAPHRVRVSPELSSQALRDDGGQAIAVRRLEIAARAHRQPQRAEISRTDEA